MSHEKAQSDGRKEPGNGSQATPRADAPNITVRRLSPTDSIPEITKLLHRAYAKQVAMGLAPLAGRQTDAQTEQRLFSGEAWVAVEHIPVPDPE
ncbi:MAG: hypothetical protein ACK5P8_02150, partial [Phycisphaerae bacterium]